MGRAEVASVTNEDSTFKERCNTAVGQPQRIAPAAGGDEADAPQPRAISATDSGMGDPLRFDAERLRILIERHYKYTESTRAKHILDNWDDALRHFVKVMPAEYAEAIANLKRERNGLRAVAAE